MSPFCSRLIISNYILAQKVVEQIGRGCAPLRPIAGRCAGVDFLVKPARRAIVREVQPARR